MKDYLRVIIRLICIGCSFKITRRFYSYTANCTNLHVFFQGWYGNDCHCGTSLNYNYGKSTGCSTCAFNGQSFNCGKSSALIRMAFVYKLTSGEVKHFLSFLY